MPYPANFELDHPLEMARWRPLVQWLLAVPHMVVVWALGYVSPVVGIISWFAILFTGSLPTGLANFQSMIIRYTMRTYSYAMFLRAPYPPFAFAVTPEDPGGDPVRVDLQPALEGRNRLTVGLRIIWAIPALLFAAVLGIAVCFVMIAAFFAVLFTGAWPEGMRSFVVRCMRYFVRVTAYYDLLTDEYPPFALE